MSTPIDLQTYRARRDAFAAYDPRIIPAYTISISDDPAEQALDMAREEDNRACAAVHDLHSAYLNDACDLTDADCAALQDAHHAWVTATAAFKAAQSACPVSEADLTDIPF